MPLAAVLGFAAISFTLIIVPGPDWAYVLAAGVRDHVVAPAVLGILTGYLIITIVVSAGVGSAVTRVPLVLTTLTVAGACYLVHLGVRTLRAKIHLSAEEHTGLRSRRRGYVARGIGVSALNPKGLLMFLSILPQFADSTDAWPMPTQFATLGGVFITIAALIYSLLGVASDRVLGARPVIAIRTSKVAGIAMVAVGSALLVERLIRVLSW